MTETEKSNFKLLNRLTGYRLIVLPSGCWMKEGTNIRRYSSIRIGKRVLPLHIVSAMIFLNHEPNTHITCHKCDIEACCNPSHLYSGTNQDNSNDMKYRRKLGIEKGEIINRNELPQEVGEFELEFFSDGQIN